MSSEHPPRHSRVAPAEAAGSGHAAPDGTLLICVDMQPAFIRAIADGERVLKRCEFALAAAQGLGIPVLFTEQVPEKLGATASSLRAASPGSAVLAKKTFSALADDGIRQAVIGDADAQHLLLCGIETPVCVYQTAIAALAQDLEVTILSDCVGARRPDDARACLDALARSGAHVLPAETVFYALLHDVSHLFFKAYTQLVKNAG